MGNFQNAWHHITAVFTQNVSGFTPAKMYFDGNYVGNSVTDRSTPCSQTLNFQIGKTYGGYGTWFNGFIDEVVFSNTTRTADEIRQAYQYGLRTHQITIDYSTGIGSSAPTSTADLHFNPTTTTNLYVGDTVIVKEKVAATSYIMQGEVTSISGGVVTVASWSGTAPPSGYTTAANVFKWQKEYWDISDIPTADRDAITKLGIRVLDGSQGFDMYLDDFKTSGDYLTNPLGGETITSTVNRYFQYRAILTTNDTSVTPALTSVTLDYTTNQTPIAPTSLLTNSQTNPTYINIGTTSPFFSAIYNDPDATDIANKYQIQVDDDSGFGSPVWDSGATGTSMNNCDQGDRCENITYNGSSLTGATTYYWRIKYWDDDNVSGAWSTGTNTFSVNYAPLAPSSLLTESLTNPTLVTDDTPEFSAIYNEDSNDASDIADKYQIQVDDDSGFGSPIWDSGSLGSVMGNCNQGDRCTDISYAGSVLAGGTTYYWRIKYWDDGGIEGVWSTENAYFSTSTAPTAPTYLLTEGLTNPTGITDTTPEFSAIYNDDTGDIANKYRIQVDDNSNFSSTMWDSGISGTALTNCNQETRCIDISYAGSTLAGGNTYYWRIKYWDQFGLEGTWSSGTDTFSVNYAPLAPTSLLTEGLTNPTNVNDTTPEFSAIYNESANDTSDIANKYQIQVDDDSGFGSPIWDSGATGTSMSNCINSNRCSDISYAGSSLAGGVTYYWRIKYWDDGGLASPWNAGTNTFSVNYTPLVPTALLTEELTNPAGVTDTTPEFSAVYNENLNNASDIANKYRIQVDDDPGFGSPIWDSGAAGTSMNNCNANNRCSDINYGGANTDLQWNTKYYWQIKYWDDSGAEGIWSTESAYFTMSNLYFATSCMIDDVSQPGSTIIEWNDNSTIETGYRVDRSIDGLAFSLLTSQPANTTTYTDSTTTANHTYQYRVTAISNNGNALVCQSSQVNYQKGTFYFQ